MAPKNKEHFIKVIKTGGEISDADSFAIVQWCSEKLSNEQGGEHEARDIIIRTLDAWKRLPPSTHDAWLSLIEAAGLYPYLKIAEREVPTSLALSYEFHRSDHLPDTYFHEEQFRIADSLLAGKSVVLSAPTSFGKSLLIEEIIASRRYRNLVIIQPTLALLDETRKKLGKYRNYYKLVVSTSQAPSETTGNIFLFTGERVVEYKMWPTIDFFVIDEFYKLSLSRDDDRAVALNQALYKLLKMTRRFYLLGPSVDSVERTFSRDIEFEWRRSDFSTVALDDIPVGDGRRLGYGPKSEILFDLLSKLNDQTLVYCSSQGKACSLAADYLSWLDERSLLKRNTVDVEIADLVKWLRDNVHAEWSLCTALQHRMAFHHGGLPRHVGSTIVDLFNTSKIRFLFCTSTLIEGVNTSAKNVVLFDNYKGRNAIDFFDFRNIAGRSGRMFKYFTGRLYRFSKTPQQFELNVDIPLFSQDDAPPELLVQLDPSEVKATAKKQLELLDTIPSDLIDIIKQNGLSVEGQLAIVRDLEGDSLDKSLFVWKTFPTYAQALAVIELGWKHLLKTNENRGGVLSPRQLAVLVVQYNRLKSLGPVIRAGIDSDFWKGFEPSDNERREKVVATVLGAARHWFDYKLPKWLGTISSLQEYVFSSVGRPYGNYTFLATQLEHGYLQKNIALLLEYDVPATALRRLVRLIPPSMEADRVFAYLRSLKLESLGLEPYELKKLRDALL